MAFPVPLPPRPRGAGSRWWTVLGAVSWGLALAALFGPFLDPAYFLAGHDTFTHDYLMWEWGWGRFFETGRLPLWNPSLFGGWPFVASFAFCPYYPPAWVSAALPTSLALTIQYLLHLGWGAAGFQAFGRALGASGPAAWLGALLYLAGGHAGTLAFPGHLAKVQAIAWLPWAMTAVVHLGRGPRARWALVLAVSGAMQLLASHLQIFYITCFLAGSYLAAALGFPGAGGRRAAGARSLGLAGAGLVLALGLSGVQLLPSAELARISNRGGAGVARAEAAAAFLPPEELPEIVLPSFRGDSTGTLRIDPGGGSQALPYLGRWNGDAAGRGAERIVSDYAGAGACCLALAGLVLARRRVKWLFALYFAGGCLIAVGDSTPVFGLAYRFAPGFSHFRSPATAMLAAHFGLFALAALGIEALRERVESAAPASLQRAGFGLAAGGAALLAVWYLRLRAPALPAEAERLARAIPGILVGKALAHVVFHLGSAALCAALLLAAVLLRRARPTPRRRALALLCFLLLGGALALDGFSQIRRFLPRDRTGHLESYLYDNWVDTAVLRAAAGEALPGVVESGREGNNRAMMRNLRTPYGYHPVVYGAYERLLRATASPDGDCTARHFAVNYRTGALEEGVPAGWRAVSEHPGRGQRLLARQAKIPFARVPLRIDPLPGGWDAASSATWRGLLGGAEADPARRTYVEGGGEWTRGPGDETLWRVRVRPEGAGVLALSWADGSPAAEQARLQAAGPDGRIPCLMPFAWDRGWQVTVRPGPAAAGERAAGWPLRANGFFALVPLDPGSGAGTTLVYAPGSFALGRTITLGCLAAVLAAVWVLHRRGRVRRLG